MVSNEEQEEKKDLDVSRRLIRMFLEVSQKNLNVHKKRKQELMDYLYVKKIPLELPLLKLLFNKSNHGINNF